jgi:hypothetical protein
MIYTDLHTAEFVQPEILGGATSAVLLQYPKFAELIENRWDWLIHPIAIYQAH